MDLQSIGLWVGVGISLILGIINFLLGPAWLASKEKVQICRVEVQAQTFKRGKAPKEQIYNFQVSADVELVRSKGDKDCYAKEIQVEFNKVLWEKLGKYFQMRPEPMIIWAGDWIDSGEGFLGGEFKCRRLDINKAETFDIMTGFTPNESLTDLYEQLNSASTNDELDKARRNIEQIHADVEILANQLTKQYKINWIRGDGKVFSSKWCRR